MKTRKGISLLLALLLCCAAMLPVRAASDASGETVRLGETAGTVAVTDASGKTLTIRLDMRLYNSYTVDTAALSSAHIIMDGTKAVRLDSNGRCEIRKNGKKLEVALISGELYFSVDQPLRSDESFQIRTSTMVTGVRGSFGWVNRFQVGMIHGHALVTCTNPVTGNVVRTEVSSAEIIRFEEGVSQSGQARAGDEDLKENDYTRETMKNEDVPAVASEEIAADSGKQALIDRDNNEDLTGAGIAGSAEAKREAQNARETEAQQASRSAIAEQQARTVEAVQETADQVFEPAAAPAGQGQEGTAAPSRSLPGSTGSSSSSGSSSSGYGTVVDDTSVDLQAQLNAAGSYTLPVSGTMSYPNVTVGRNQTLTLSGSGTVNMNQLTIGEGGTVNVGPGVTLGLSGADMDQRGTLNISSGGTANSSAEQVFLSTAALNNEGTFNNSGTLSLAPGASVTGGIANTGTVIHSSGDAVSVSGGGKVIEY